ncbi:S-layer-like y domain-containing protein, partial [Dysosmobacter welbionis]
RDAAVYCAFSRQVGWQTKRRGLQGREMGGPLSSKERGYLSFICPSYIPGAGRKNISASQGERKSGGRVSQHPGTADKARSDSKWGDKFFSSS